MDAIVLAAGRGTRMAPICSTVPKPLLPLGDTTILGRLVEQVRPHVDTVKVVVHHGANHIRDALSDVEFVDQGEPRGTGHAVAAAAGNNDALVLMGDAVVDEATISALAQSDFAVGGSRVEEVSAYGALSVDGGVVAGIAEKSQAGPGWANTGLYRVPAEVLAKAASLTESPRGELEFTDLIQGARLVEASGWSDVGSPWDYLSAHERLLPDLLQPGGEVEEGVVVRGRLQVAPGGVVKSGTYIEGDVYVGPGSVVGPNAYLRGPVGVYGAKIGAGSEVKNSILLPGAAAPHRNYVGDSILGRNCNLGAGSTIANLKIRDGNVFVNWDGKRIDSGRRKFGAVIGDEVKTGIMCAFNPGTILGAGARVGPGAVVSGWVGPGEIVR